MPRTRIDYFDQAYFGTWSEGAHEWARSRGRHEGNPLWEEAKLLDQLKPVTVLDWGCGRGELMGMLARLGRSQDRRCWGYDPSVWSSKFRAVTFAEFETEDRCHGTDSDFTLPDLVQNNPIEGFDLVIFRNVFECLDPEAIPRSPNAEVERTMRKLLVHCRRGGRIAVKTPWFAKAFDPKACEEATQRIRYAGAARHLVPWSSCDAEGRLQLMGRDGWNAIQIYETLTNVNPWTQGWDPFAAMFFPGLPSSFEAGWLVVEKP